MKFPLSSIIREKVAKRELQRIFNEIEADLTRRTTQRVEIKTNMASQECGQVPGTTSHIVDWMEYDVAMRKMKLLATVHYFRCPDGTIGASGKYDPIQIVHQGKLLFDP